LKEYVDTEKEFLKLTQGRIHWMIRTEPIIAGNGIKKMETGELELVVEVTGIAKEAHLVLFCVSFGWHYPKSEGYSKAVSEIHSYVKESFKGATRGRWTL
jgi:hypothetical protein